MLLPWQRAVWNPIRRPSLSLRPKRRGARRRRVASPAPLVKLSRLGDSLADATPAPVTSVTTVQISAHVTVRVIR